MLCLLEPLRAGRAATALAAALWLSGCVTEFPQAPGWPTTIGVPIAQDTTTIGRIARKHLAFLALDTDHRLVVDFTTRFGPGGRALMGDRLRLHPRGGSFTHTLDPLAIADRELPAAAVSLADILGQAGLPGQALEAPATSFTSSAPVALEDVELLQVSTGQVVVVLANDLTVGLAQVAVTLLDAGRGGATIGRVVFRGVPARASPDSAVMDLRSRVLSGDLVLRLSGQTEAGTIAATGGPEPRLRARASLRGLRAQRAVARLTEQPLESADVIEIPVDTLQLRRGAIRSGALQIGVHNHLPAAVDLEFRLPHMTDAHGATPSVSVTGLAPDGERDLVLQLAGYVYAPANPGELELTQRGRVHATQGIVSMGAGDSISVRVEPRGPVVFERVEAVLRALELPVEPAETAVDFPPGLGNLEFRTAAMRAYLEIGTGVLGKLDLGVLGENDAGGRVSFRVVSPLVRGSPLAPVHLVVVPRSDDFTGFLNLLPRRVVFSPTLVLGDGRGVESIAADHWVQVDSVRVTSGSWFRILGPTRIENEPDGRRVSRRGRQMVEDGYLGGRIETSVESGMPLNVRVRILVARRREDVYLRPDLVIPREGAYQVAPVPVDEAGRLGAPVLVERRSDLSREDMLLLVREGGVYTGVLLELEPTDTEIELHESYYVVVTSRGWADVEINPDLK